MAQKQDAATAATTDRALLVRDADMLERLLKAGIDMRGIEIIDIALPDAASRPGLPARVPVAVKHTANGPAFESLAPLFEAFRTAPERRAGTAQVTTLQTFIDLVNRHKDEGSAVFAKTIWPAPKLVAVIDYHGIDKVARFGRHRVEYAFPITPEFEAWMKQDGKPFEQGEFATFLEDHAAELTAPSQMEINEFEPLFKERFAPPHELINLSRSLEICVGSKIKRQERLASGERTLVFESEHTNAQGERIDVPGIFMVSVAAFVDGGAVRIPARLRYRVKGGEILWFYNLYRAADALRGQVLNDIVDVGAGTGLPVFEGAPEAAA